MRSATFVAEGSTDQSLCAVLNWVITQYATSEWTGVTFADFYVIGKPKKLADRIKCALDYYPCDLLFVHRDADKQDPGLRYEEIRRSVPSTVAHVCVVPITMQEAWFLFDEPNLRRAVGRPNGRQPLALPKLTHVEEIADPKSLLHELLRKASEKTGRDARQFSPEDAIFRMSELIEDWSPLRQLSAFRRLEEDTRRALVQLES